MAMKFSPCPQRDGSARLLTCDAMATAGSDITPPIGHRKRLRERLLKSGGEGLHDYELLEMVLFAAMPRGDAKPLAKRLIDRFDGFAGAIAADQQALRSVEGMGDAGIAALKVVEVAAQRLGQASVINRPVLSNWDRLIEYCRMQIGRSSREHFRILFLNRRNVLITDEEQQRGTIDHTPVYPREVVKRALELGASAIIMVHNHPSGDPEPSRGDIDMTHEIRDVAGRLDIALHDHVIVSSSGHRSFKSMGLL